MASREVVVRLQLDDKDSVSKFQALRKEQAQLEIDFAATKKAIRDNAKELIGLNEAYAKGAIDADQLAAKVGVNRTQFDALTKTLSDTDINLSHVKLQTRELRNDLNGATDAGLRFRDKMADANLVALKNAGILGQLDARSASLTQEMNALTAAYEKGAKTEKEYQTETAKLQKELDATNAKSSTLEKKIEQLNLEFKAGKLSQEEYRAGIASVGKSTDALGSKFDQFAKGQAGQLKSTLSSVALQYVGVGAAVYGLQKIVGGAIDIVVEFDKKLANVSALGGEYRDNIDSLGEAARNIGPKFGVGAGKALDSVEALAKAGVGASDILGGALEGALTLAASGELDAGQAAEYAASTMVQFGLAGKDVAHIADLLSASANKAQGEVSDFGNALKFVGPVAASMNVSLDETVGTLADFAQNGILGEQAGTSLRGVLSSLTSPSKAATDELKALGVVTEDGASKLFDAQGKFKGLANLAGVLQEATKNLTQEERANALGKIFGNQQLTAANILIKDGEKGIRDFTTAVNDQGIAEQVATDKLNSLKGATDRMTSAWGAFILSIEDGKGAIGGTITALENMFTTILEGLTATGKDKSLDAFSGKVDEILAKSKDFEKVKFYNVSAQKSVKALDAQVKALDQYKTTLGEVQLEEEARAQLAARLADLQSKPFSAQSTIEQAAIQVAIEGYDKVIGKRKEELAQQGEGVKGSAQSAAATLKEAETLATLGDKLKELQDARKAIDITDTKGLAQNKAQIDALQNQINALNGTAKATSVANDASKERVQILADITKAERDRANANVTPQQKEVAQATTTRDDRVGKAQGDTALLLKIEEEYQAQLTEIQTRYAADRLVQRQQAEDNAAAFIQGERDKAASEELQALQKTQEQELIIAAHKGEDLPALMRTQSQKRQSLIQELRDAEVQKVNDTYEAQYAAADAAGASTVELQRSHEEALAALKGEFRSQDEQAEKESADHIAQIRAAVTQQEIGQFQAVLSSAQSAIQSISDAQQARTDAELAQIDRRITAAKAEGRNTTELEKQRAEVEAEAAKKRAAAQRLSAIVTAMSSIAAAIGQAIAAAAPGDPYTVAARIAAAAAAAIAAGAAVYKAINAIPAFAEGGEVPDQRGTVTSSWGKPIRRSNGDDVLVTLKRKEKVLNADQIARAEAIAGKGFWGRIGLPNHPTYASTTAFLTDQQAPRKQRIAGYAIGGTVGYIASPTVAELSAERNVAELRAINFQPVVSVVEINKVQNRTRVAESLGTA